MLQPRRVAARTVASRMAQLFREPLGQTVGYHIRHDRKASKKTRILVITEGMLNRYMVSDPFLERFDTLILDEFHERSVHADLALSFARTLQDVREGFKLVVMSATLELNALQEFLDDPALVEVKVPRFPLKTYYRPSGVNVALEDRVLEALREHENTPQRGQDGDVLVFLPGARDIQKTVEAISASELKLEALPFYSALEANQQERLFEPGPHRRVICATNIAETSLTLPNIRTVIDTGFHKMSFHEAAAGSTLLRTKRISQASAEQRAGRAGRLGPGSVYRLWSQEDHAARVPFDEPEIKRCDLASVLLGIFNLHGPNLDSFPFFESPLPSALEEGRQLLELLGAIDSNSNLTEKGTLMLSLPLAPRMASILIDADGSREWGARLCPLLESGLSRNQATHSLTTQIERLFHSDRHAIHARVYRQIRQQATSIWPHENWQIDLPEDNENWLPLLMSGYPDRVCILKEEGKKGILASGRHVFFRCPMPNFEYALVLDLDTQATGRSSNLGVSYALGFNWGLLQKLGANNIHKEKATWFDTDKEQVVCREQWRYGSSLIVRRGAYLDCPQEEGAHHLADWILSRFEHEFQPDQDATHLMWRLRFAARHLPTQNWPDLSDQGLKNSVPDVCLRIVSRNQPRLAFFHGFDWKSYWLSLLDWKQRQVLEQEVPAAITLATGRSAVIRYQSEFGPEGRPIMSAILQHLFGTHELPKLANGRVVPLLHILGPHRRPVQVTSDLKGFWSGSYKQVRQELKGKYPKHDWPENPP